MTGCSPEVFCSIVPPYILRHLARHTDPDVHAPALLTLSLDNGYRRDRLAVPRRPAHGATRQVRTSLSRTISDARHSYYLPGRTVRDEGQPPVRDVAVNEAYDGLGSTFAFYLKVYGRNSIDGAGLPLYATVHYGRGYDNAFWDGHRMIFGDGDGRIFLRFTKPLEVIGHELTHGVTLYTAHLVYSGQSGALNESISDVFGSLIKQYTLGQTVAQADWLIGAELLAPGVGGAGLRSLKAPGTAYADPRLGRDPQPAKMSGYVETVEDNGGVHINSGIPNHAFYLVAAALGGHAWERAGRIWYTALTSGTLPRDASFAQFAEVTVGVATTLYGMHWAEGEAVRRAWAHVGIRTTGPVL